MLAGKFLGKDGVTGDGIDSASNDPYSVAALLTHPVSSSTKKYTICDVFFFVPPVFGTSCLGKCSINDAVKTRRFSHLSFITDFRRRSQQVARLRAQSVEHVLGKTKMWQIQASKTQQKFHMLMWRSR